MPLKSVTGVDHVVVAVRDLDAAAAVWASLGFSMSPRGLHSAHLGTGNYTTMFQDDYLELLGIVNPTDQNTPTRDFLKEREGIERTAFTAIDAEKGAEELRSRGLEPLGPVNFGRPVPLPGGGETEARFSVFRWPLVEKPGGMRIFACQHHTRPAVWIPEIMHHPNGATRIVRIEILSADPKASAAHMSRLIDQPITHAADGAPVVASGGTRADFVFLDQATLAGRYPAQALAGVPTGGAVSLVLGTSDLAGATKALGARGVAHHGGVSVAAKDATGVIVSFVPN